MKYLTIAAAAATLAFAVPSVAQDQYPLVPAEFVEVTGIYIDDGHELEYANHLATIWRSGQEFAKGQGWIEGYEILANTHARKGEPDLYLLTRFKDWESPEEGDRRQAAYQQHMQQSIAQMQQASAGRAQYRTVGGEMLLRRMVWRK